MARRRSQKKNRSMLGVFTVVLLLAAAAGFGYWLTMRLPIAPPQVTASQSRPSNRVVLHPRKNVQVFVIKMHKDEPRLVAESRRIAADSDPKVAAIEHLISTNKETGDSRYLIPTGTKLIALHVKDGIAYVDFSREIRDNFPGGSTNDELLVDSIVRTLTQFKDVRKVQILVDGKRIDSIGGAMDISSPISADSAMLGQGDS